MMSTGLLTEAAHRLATGWVLAQPGDYDPTSGRGPEWGKAAPAGLLIWLFMGVALFFLIKSMNRHMKRVPKSFEDSSATDGGADARAAAPDVAGDASVPDAEKPDMTLSSAGADPAADKPE